MRTTPSITRSLLLRGVGGVFGAALTVAMATALATILTTALTAGTASADAPPAAQLRIAVDNGRTSATAGDELVYTITVENLGTEDLTGLEVTQTVPPGLTFESAEPAGTAEAGGIRWEMDLAAAAKATVTSTMTVGATPPELLRLATVACANASVGGPPVVCSTHSDQLPAGAAADAGRASEASATSPAWWLYAGGAAVVVILAGLVVLALRARRTPSS